MKTRSKLSIFLLFSLCFLSYFMQAQEIPSTLFGDYEGDASVAIPMLETEYSTSGVTVTLKKTGGVNDYILEILDFNFYDISINMDNIIITPDGDRYKLSRIDPISFIIPEITIPPLEPLFPDGATFTNVPVKIKLGNTTIKDFVLDINIQVVATVTVVVIVPIPFDIPIDIAFNGEMLAPQPNPPIIRTTELEAGIVKEEYFAILEAESEIPVVWSISEGVLPTGLALNAGTGIISGTPTEANIFNFTVQATNALGFDTKELFIEIETDTLGVSTSALSQILIYPNPTTGELRITNYELRIGSIEIFDVMGRKVGAKSPSNELEGWQPQADGVVIDLSHLYSGTYFLKIKTESGTIVRKVIKQ